MAVIRRIQEEEVAAAVDLWCAYAEELGDPGEALSDSSRGAIRQHLLANAHHADATCLVAVEDGDVVGFATGAALHHPTLSGTLGEIEELYVAPNHRRHRIGTELVGAMLSWLGDHDVSVLKVRVGRGSGEPRAVSFWQAQGFEQDMLECSLYPAATLVR